MTEPQYNTEQEVQAGIENQAPQEAPFGSTLPPQGGQEAPAQPTFADMLRLHVAGCRKNLADAEEALAMVESYPDAEKLLRLLKIAPRGM